jgi:hypothetical protein
VILKGKIPIERDACSVDPCPQIDADSKHVAIDGQWRRHESVMQQMADGGMIDVDRFARAMTRHENVFYVVGYNRPLANHRQVKHMRTSPAADDHLWLFA